MSTSNIITSKAHTLAYDVVKDPELRAYLVSNPHDIEGILNKAKAQLEARNEMLTRQAHPDKTPLNTTQIRYAIQTLRDLLVDEIASVHPTQQMFDETRKAAYQEFNLRTDIITNLDKVSLEVMLLSIFETRARSLANILRNKGRERQLHNSRLEALNHAKTFLTGLAPSNGQMAEKVTITGSDEEFIKLNLSAKIAGFNLKPYISKSTSDAEAAVCDLPYVTYQQLVSALNGYTEKLSHITSQEQITLTDLKNHYDRALEMMSTLSKKRHDLLQLILRNIA